MRPYLKCVIFVRISLVSFPYLTLFWSIWPGQIQIGSWRAHWKSPELISFFRIHRLHTLIVLLINGKCEFTGHILFVRMWQNDTDIFEQICSDIVRKENMNRGHFSRSRDNKKFENYLVNLSMQFYITSVGHICGTYNMTYSSTFWGFKSHKILGRSYSTASSRSSQVFFRIWSRFQTRWNITVMTSNLLSLSSRRLNYRWVRFIQN